VPKDNDFELPLKIGEFKTAAVTGGCTHAAGEPIMIVRVASMASYRRRWWQRTKPEMRSSRSTLFKGEDEAIPVRQTVV
jgi:hypothetical protein